MTTSYSIQKLSGYFLKRYLFFVLKDRYNFKNLLTWYNKKVKLTNSQYVLSFKTYTTLINLKLTKKLTIPIIRLT